jgi:hypothetical protein
MARLRMPGTALVAALLVLVLSAGAQAQWCGDNGVIRFSLAEGDSIVSVLHAEPENGVVLLEVSAWLTDVVPVARAGEAFLHTGGFEFELEVLGAEAFVTSKNVPAQHLDMGQSPTDLQVGLGEGIAIRQGRALLATWTVMFQGKPEDVVFKLKDGPGRSCTTVPGCEDCGPPAVYIGVEGSRQLACFFGAGYVPSYLNPKGEVAQDPVTGSCTFEDVGIFERR